MGMLVFLRKLCVFFQYVEYITNKPLKKAIVILPKIARALQEKPRINSDLFSSIKKNWKQQVKRETL